MPLSRLPRVEHDGLERDRLRRELALERRFRCCNHRVGIDAAARLDLIDSQLPVQRSVVQQSLRLYFPEKWRMLLEPAWPTVSYRRS